LTGPKSFDVDLETWDQFHQHFTHSFYACRSQKHKKTVKSAVFFCAFEIYTHKSFKWNIGEIDPWGQFHQPFMSRFYKQRSHKHKKKHWWRDCPLVLMGSLCVKAVRKHVGEIYTSKFTTNVILTFGENRILLTALSWSLTTFPVKDIILCTITTFILSKASVVWNKQSFFLRDLNLFTITSIKNLIEADSWELRNQSYWGKMNLKFLHINFFNFNQCNAINWSNTSSKKCVFLKPTFLL